eukprot:3281141-Pleurochrysis_carterae.AAC.1
MNLCHPVVRMLVPIIRLTFADLHSSPAAPFSYHAVVHCLASVERTRHCAGSDAPDLCARAARKNNARPAR